MKTEDGDTLGETFGDVSHLLSHMRENYFVPSLLLNALKEQAEMSLGSGEDATEEARENFRWAYHNGIPYAARTALRSYLQRRTEKLTELVMRENGSDEEHRPGVEATRGALG
jgi:hypothetical protein